MRKLRLGLIGCGRWGPNFLRNFKEMDDAAISWIVDNRSDRLDEANCLYPEAQKGSDVQVMLQDGVDAVVIATPLRSHYPLAIQCLQEGKHILVEKPLAMTVAQAEEIAELADRSGLVAMVGHTYLYSPAVNEIRDLLYRNELGQIYYVESSRANLGVIQSDLDVVWDLAPHDLSILLHIFKARPTSIMAYGETYVRRHAQVEVARMRVEFDNGATAHLGFSWLHPVKVRTMVIVGSERMILYNDLAPAKVTIFEKKVKEELAANGEMSIAYYQGSAYAISIVDDEPLRLECRAFLDWILRGKRACSDATSGLEIVKLLVIAQQSMWSGGTRERV